MRRGRALAASFGLLILLAVPASWAVASPPPNSVSVAVRAVPSNGSVPLLVALSATVTPVGAYSISWNFGDGAYSNGTSTTLLNVSHWYSRSGTFHPSVSVSSGSAEASAGTVVVVRPNPLVASINASTTSGSVPLNVTFAVEPSGGSGTYDSFSWTFGDGVSGSGLRVTHEYVAAGRYEATVYVNDSSNGSAVAHVWIEVQSGAAAPGPRAPAVGLASGWYGVVGLGGLAVAIVAVVLFVRSPRRLVPATPRSVGPLAAATEVPGLIAGPPSVVVPSATLDGPDPSSSRETGPPSTLAAGATRQASHELLVFLLQLGAIGPEDVPDRRWTQAGISEGLGMSQSSVSNLLRRLHAARAVSIETRHVRGASRRLRVYLLTARGELVARGLRQRGVRPRSGPVASPGPERESAERPSQLYRSPPPTDRAD